MGTLVRLLLAALLAATLLPLSATFLVRVWRDLAGPPTDGLACLVGAVLAVALVVWRRPNKLLHTMIHEGCHALACLLLFVRISRFSASDGQGGEVRHRAVDPLRGALIAIAPYTLPLLLAPALIVHYYLPLRGWWRPVWSGLVVFLFVHHLVGLERNVRINFWGSESDLVKVGRPLAVVLIASALLAVSAWTLYQLWH